MARVEVDPNYSNPTFSRGTVSSDLFKKEDDQLLAAAVSTHTHATGYGLPIAALGASVTVPAGGMTFTGGPIHMDAVSNLTVNGTATLAGDTLIGGTLTVNGPANFIGSPVSITAPLNLTGNLNVSGSSHLQSSVAIGTQAIPATGLSIQGATPTVSPAILGLGYTIGAPSGANTALTGPLRGAGSGPASAVATNWWQVNLGGTACWIPYFV
jgi:hypothetical protein